MYIRQTRQEDFEVVKSIYEEARRYMRENGNPSQWAGGYPSDDIISDDIASNISYVCIDDNQIVGVFCYFHGIDSTYIKIYEGMWINDKPYGVVHRIASNSHKKGVASFCLNWAFNQCNNLKIDTHRDNIVMQRLLNKNGFVSCGIIYLEDGSERIAYQKIT